ncbi:MAG: two-component sensor CbrA [Porticoccaceae bacterium]|nr:MAG: two-component sensor CbrA [Porticoccaceae bacterium]
MSSDALALALAGVIFLGPALLAALGRLPETPWRRPLPLALAVVAATGVPFFFGAVELVGRYGFGGLVGIFAFAGAFILSPLFIDPIRWISRRHALATVPDLLAFRTRSRLVAAVAAALLAVGSLPLAAAQLALWAEPGVAGTLLVAVAAAFASLCSVSRRARQALPAACALAGAAGLAAVLAVGWLAVERGFGGLEALNAWAESSGQNEVAVRFDNAYALILLFFPLALILPQVSFLLGAEEERRPFALPGWTVPLVLLGVTLPVFPILWAGLRLPLEVPLQEYALALPAALDSGALALLGRVAAALLALAFLATTAVAVGRTLVTAWLVQPGKPLGEVDLERWLGLRTRALAWGWLGAAWGVGLAGQPGSVTDLTICGMVGLAQLLPALVATLFLPFINRRGLLAGLATGSALWGYGLVGPLFFAPESPTLWGLQVALGPANWPFWLLESLAANLLVAALVSLVTPTTPEERHYAEQCAVDNLPPPQRQGVAPRPSAAVAAALADWIGPAARAEVERALAHLGAAADDQRPATLRALRDQLCFQLSAKLGTLAADRIVEAVLPPAEGPVVDDIALIEAQLERAGDALSGLAAELNRLRLYHRQTLENLPVGVCSVDPEGEILLWNHAMARYTGIARPAAEGAKLADLAPPWGGLLAAFRAAPAERWPSHRLDWEVSSRWFHLTKHAIPGPTPQRGDYLVILMEEITDYLRLVREAAHAERLASVGRLAAGVAHEIGNPLTGISCLAQELLEETRDPAAGERLATILDLTRRIAAIVSTLIDFARRDQEPRFEAVPLARVVEDAIRLLALDKGSAKVAFRTAIPDDLCVRGDPHQLAQVFLNLLANARDASREGDPVEVVAEAISGQRVRVSVVDHGAGIAPEHLPRVMDPFFTTKEPGKGTGLGLSLVYGIVRAHGGTIAIESPVAGGRGTRASLVLVRAQTTEGNAPCTGS